MKILRWLARVAQVQSTQEQDLQKKIDSLQKKNKRLAEQVRLAEQKIEDLETTVQELEKENHEERLSWEKEQRRIEVKTDVQAYEIELLNEVIERNRMRIEAETATACGEVAASIKPKAKRE